MRHKNSATKKKKFSLRQSNVSKNKEKGKRRRKGSPILLARLREESGHAWCDVSQDRERQCVDRSTYRINKKGLTELPWFFPIDSSFNACNVTWSQQCSMQCCSFRNHASIAVHMRMLRSASGLCTYELVAMSLSPFAVALRLRSCEHTCQLPAMKFARGRPSHGERAISSCLRFASSERWLHAKLSEDSLQSCACRLSVCVSSCRSRVRPLFRGAVQLSFEKG